jgi:hypothetical protein
MEAWMNKSELKIEGTGIGYMLQGDKAWRQNNFPIH